MNIGKAIAICEDISTDKWTVPEKIMAVRTMASMETHNSVTKQTMLGAIKWMLARFDDYNAPVESVELEALPGILDTICRQDALDIFDDYNMSVENGELEAYSRDRKRLCDLPSAQPEQRWIPTSERPPEKDGDYLVWMTWGRPGHEITEATYRGGYWDIKTSISAWMPLPGPYIDPSANRSEFLDSSDAIVSIKSGLMRLSKRCHPHSQ